MMDIFEKIALKTNQRPQKPGMKTRTLFMMSLFFSLVFAGNSKILHLEGTYDLDSDGHLEYITIEEQPSENRFLSFIRYYETDDAGRQELLWDLNVPDGALGSFIGVDIGDIDGDTYPELIVGVNVSGSGSEDILQPHFFVYRWFDNGFEEIPDVTLNLAGNKKFLRCHNFELLDIDADGDEEVVASLGIPLRGVAIIDMDAEGTLSIIEQLIPTFLRSGSGFIFADVVDYDHDGFDDLIVFSPEGNVLKAQPFYNVQGTFIPSKGTRLKIDGINGFLPLKTTKTDWDADGFTDVVLSFQSGHIAALTMTPDKVVIEEIPVEGGPVSDLKITDVDQDGYTDIILVSGEMNMVSLFSGTKNGVEPSAEYFSLDGGNETMQIFSILPMVRLGTYTGYILAAGWNGSTNTVFLTDLGKKPTSPPEKPDVIISNVIEQEKLLETFPEIPMDQFTLPQVSKPEKTTGQPLPENVLPRHVLPVNKSFAYTIPEDEAEIFYSFRWLQPPPKGMFFHYETKSIQWVPNEKDLGAFQLAYHIEMKIGETIVQNEEDSLAYQVIPQLEGYDERLWIYVNDPPVFISEPTGTEFVANTLFSYEPLIQDRNVDANIQIDIEVAPDEMVMDSNTLTWQTDSAHVDIYPVRLVATDGFDRAAQEFKLFARAGVVILSEPFGEPWVGEPYEYQMDVWYQNLNYPLEFELIDAPEGMTINTDGLVAWTPTETQIDTQKTAIIVRHGVAADTQSVELFVNHPPIVVTAPPPMVLVRAGETWDFQIDIFDPNILDEITYSSIELPPGMRMDPYSGRLLWEPSWREADFSHLMIEVSDGKTTRIIEADFFVNAPIQIVSLPTLTATTGDKYTYSLLTSDRNNGSLLPMNRVVTVEDVESIKVYKVNITDDIYRENIDRYIGDWEHAKTVYLSGIDTPDTASVSRLNLKKYVHSLFYEEDRLVVILQMIDDRTVRVKDVLWELFKGSKGKPPKVIVERQPLTRYTLLDFPDGMIVNELTGTISWTSTPNQVDIHTITVLASDGYSKDEQTYELYVNQTPTIISNPPAMALVGDVFKYTLQVEDNNQNAELAYSLIKSPRNMQISREGKILWTPESDQIDYHVFEVKVSDGYSEDVQTGKVFVNINPTIISKPKPVALTGHDYRYQMVAEDLNSDKVTYRPIRLPKYANFNKRTGKLKWKPRNNQRGPNDIIIMAIDEHGAATAHEFQVHVFEDPSARQFVNTSWPLMLTFVGVMFAWGISQI